MAISLAMRAQRAGPAAVLRALRTVSLRFASGTSGVHQDVGFIGLGNMGSHMAANLLTAGHHLTVHDRNEAVVQAFADRGASIAQTPREVAEASDVVITMLPSSPHVDEVYTGRNGILADAGAVRPSLLIDASTIDPHTCRMLAAKVAKCTLLMTSICG